MKRLYLLIISLGLIFLPNVVFASSANISVSGANTVQVGNTVTITVNITSKNKIGSWQADLSYDKSLLQLTSSGAESGGTYMANTVPNGTKSKSYTFKFKALKSGSAKVSVSSYTLYDYDTLEQMSVSTSSKTINLKTKEEIEASYSSNANLKSINVSDYPLSPEFNKDTLEYNVEVENEIEKVNISASKEDSTATVSGTGEKDLLEGNNKIEIVVTAQKGNTNTYIINIYRKELDPINVTLDGKNFSVVRKTDNMPTYGTFAPTTVTYEDTEIPALKSEITGYTLIGLKDEEGNIITYLFEDGKITTKYVEVKSNAITLYPLSLKENNLFKNYIKNKLEINGINVDCYMLNKSSKTAIIYAQNIENGEINYYTYDINNKTAQAYDKELNEYYEKMLTKYKYIILGMAVILIIFLFIIIIRKPSPKKDKNKTLVKEIENHIDNEIKEELDKTKEDKKKNKSLD